MSNKTEQTLLEQLRITDFDIDYRQRLLNLTESDKELLKDFRTVLAKEVDQLVSEFYKFQTSVPEIALVIGDADTLSRLRRSQRSYVLSLFGGVYDREYINNRLRIGLVHKRMGVESKLYLASVNQLKGLLFNLAYNKLTDEITLRNTLQAIEKIMSFDVTLVFETYIRSLVSEVEISRDKSEKYALLLEEKVRERTEELEKLSRTDALTGLLNTRDLHEILVTSLRRAERRSELVTLAYLDVDNFKIINDTEGHQRGDSILMNIGRAIKEVTRLEDSAFRYGGDEFCVILSNCTEEQAKENFEYRLIEKIKCYEQNLRISVGYAQTGPEIFVTAEELIKQADNLMYIRKKATKEALAASAGSKKIKNKPVQAAE